jgi:peptidoglycan/LPS O-acetylase OafA/YrhL
MAPSPSSKLDFLRATAVLIVIMSHIFFETYTLAVSGSVGVLLFFVHTSLVLMFSLERQARISGHRRLFTTFMLRRVLRIFPLSVIVVLAVFSFGIPGYVFPDGHVFFTGSDGPGLASQLLLVQNVIVSNGGSQLIGVLWTLPLELQMYLLLPAIFLLLPRISSLQTLLLLWGASLLGAIGTPPMLSLAFGPSIGEFEWGWIVFPRLPDFAPAFLAGIIAYALWRRVNRRLPFATLPILLTVMLGGYAAIVYFIGNGHLLVVFGLTSCLGIGMLLPSITEPSSRTIRVVSATIAKYSYGIYLVHVPCIWLGFDVLGDQPVLVQWIFFLLSTGAVSAFLYHAIERPFILLGARIGRHWSSPAHLMASPER